MAMESEVAGGVGMKRGYADDEYTSRPYKHSRRTGPMTARLLLIGKYCGAVVGKGGAIVKQLREKHSVQINGLNRHTEQRVLAVMGDRENIISALREIIPVAGLEAPHPASQQKCQFEINLLVHSGHIGAVIGKGGSKIREITEVSQGKVQIHQECLPNSNERVVAIGGSDIDRIVDALHVIFDTVESLPKREEDKLYEPNDDHTLGEGGGAGGGRAPAGGGGGSGGGGGGGYNNQSQAPNNGNASVRRVHEQHNNNMMQHNNNNANNNPIGLALGGNQLMNNQNNQLQQAAFNQQQQLALNNSLGNLGGVNNLLGQLGNQVAAAAALQRGNMMGQGMNIGGGGGPGMQRPGMQGPGMQGPGMQGPGMQGPGMQGPGMNRGGGGGGGNGQQFGNQMNNQQFNNNNNNHHGGGNFNQYESNQLDFLQVTAKLELTVTPEMCGAIIGKGGASIKEVRATSGVKIAVTGNEKGSKDDRTITLTGTQQQLQTAQHMITDFVRSYRK